MRHDSHLNNVYELRYTGYLDVLAVMGDIGKGLYVAEDVVPIYRGLLSQASIITPNQFETE